MININQVCLVGRLTAKPVLRQTTNGIATTSITVAVNRNYTDANGQRQTDFIPVKVWRKHAENICNYLDKGSQVSVEGRLQVDSYTDKQGNKRNLTYVLANNVYFLDSKNAQKNQNIVQNGVKKEQERTIIVQNDEQVDIYSEFGDEIDDNYLD